MRKRTVAVIAAVAAVGGCAAVSMSGSGTDSTTSTTVTSPKTGPNVIGNWKVLTPKPKITKSYGTFDTVRLDVKNISDSPDEPWLEIRLTKGNRLVTTFDCVGQTVRPGEVTTLECTSLDDYRPWTKVEIRNAF